MGGKTAVGLGLVAGVVTGALVLGALLAMAPVPGADRPSTGPAPAPSGSPAASGAAGPSGSPATGPPSAAPSGGPGTGAPGSPPAQAPATLPPGPGEAFGIGAPAPPLVVPRLGGGTIDLAELRGRPVWVNFMATWCLPCRDELPLMVGFAVRHEADGLVVLAIDVREDEATVRAFMEDLGVVFPVGLDLDGTAQRAWRAYGFPVHFWVDRDGIVRDGALGGIGPDLMVEGLRAILPGVDVRT